MAAFLGLEAHAGFILACYGITLLVVALLVAWVVIDQRSLTRTFKDLEAAGARRRSDRGASSGPVGGVGGGQA